MTGYKSIIFLSILLYGCGGEETLRSKNEVKAYELNFENRENFNFSANADLKLPPTDYVSWVRDPYVGLYRERKYGNTIISLQYKPKEYMALLDLGIKETKHVHKLAERMEEYSALQYFELKITLEDHPIEPLKYNAADSREYQERVNYYAFYAQYDAYLIYDDKDTLPCAIHHMERNYDAGPYLCLQFGFSAEKEPPGYKEKVFLFRDRIFEGGLVKFRYYKDQVNYLPKLDLI